MFFSSFCNLLDALRKEPRTTKKKELLTCFFNSESSKEQIEIIMKLFNLKKQKVSTGISKKTIKKFLESISILEEVNSLKKEVQIKEVFELVETIIKITGDESTNKRLSVISEFAKRLSISEVKWLLLILSSDLRIGVNLAVLSSVLTETDVGSSSLQIGERCFNLAKSFKEGLATLDNSSIYIEPKYDGIRIMIKKQGTHLSVTTRRGDEICEKLPTLIEAFPLESNSLILDCQLLLPSFHDFSEILRHKTKVFTNYRIIVFDLISLEKDGHNILKDAILEKRKEILKDIIGRFKKLELIQFLEKDKGPYLKSQLLSLLDSYENIEGFILKKKNQKYQPGKRSWFKLKRDRESLDLLVLSRKKGTGKYSEIYSSFELGILKDNKITHITNVGSGFTEEMLTIINQDTNWVPENNQIPSRKLIFEVVFDELVRSTNNVGFSLRFPVFKRLREDKDTPSSIEDFLK
jgi:DNA ligase-1